MSSTVSSHRIRSFLTDLKVREHSLEADVQKEQGGEDLGFDPHDLLQAALAACTTMTLQMYANRKQWPLESADVQVKILTEDRQKTVIERQIRLIGTLDDDQRQRLFDIAEKCPIHGILTRPTEIQTSLI